MPYLQQAIYVASGAEIPQSNLLPVRLAPYLEHAVLDLELLVTRLPTFLICWFRPLLLAEVPQAERIILAVPGAPASSLARDALE